MIIITVDDPKAGSLNPASVIDSLESVESMAWPNPVPERYFHFWTIICTTPKKIKQNKKQNSIYIEWPGPILCQRGAFNSGPSF